MTPFLDIGTNQLADSCVGEPVIVAKVKFCGVIETGKKLHQRNCNTELSHCRFIQEINNTYSCQLMQIFPV